MFAKSIQYYDKIYSFKNYTEEAQKIRALIFGEHPAACTVLDVACGTAEHALLLSDLLCVDGIDIEPGFIEVAQRKVPGGVFWVADMRSFQMEKTYDVVQCLFSSIGYITSGSEVVEALQCFRKHLNPGGIVLVEPWFTPEKWNVGIPWMITVDEPGLKVCRMNVSAREGDTSLVHFHYLIGKEDGVEHFEETHKLALYRVEQMLEFFAAAGLNVHFDAEGIFGRGMYIGRIKAQDW